VEKFAILIVGRGKLAAELLEGLGSQTISRVVRWDERGSHEGDRCMVIHAGSGRELNDVVGFCSVTGSILLNLSTGDSQFPVTTTFPVVICPNVNMQMLYFMAMVKHSSRYFRGQDIKISESHQASKSTKPGTAIYLARSLGVPETVIRSERDPRVQNEVLGISSSFLDRHAYHEIVIKNPEVEIRLETRVLGKSAYASGLAKVIDIVARRKLAPGYYDIVDLILNDT
jgi:4-hydroxy-tetrahydrodipicolinate reductase